MLAVFLLGCLNGIRWGQVGQHNCNSECLPLQVYDVMEVFAGEAKLSRCLLACGYTVASLDISYWKEWATERRKAKKPVSTNNPLDLTTDAGFGLLRHIFKRKKCIYSLGMIERTMIASITSISLKACRQLCKASAFDHLTHRPSGHLPLRLGLFVFRIDIQRLNL